MQRIGIDVPESDRAYTLDEAKKVANRIGFPLVIRPSFTLGGTGGSIAYNIEEFENLAQKALESSIIREILIEESVIGWKEIELEVMRDSNDNVVVICSIENFDPMGIHTEIYYRCTPPKRTPIKNTNPSRFIQTCHSRNGVASGCCNRQFALNPTNGKTVIIEMNPEFQNSALAFQATDFQKPK
jgi:carbamoyl-phosphate synthase large subunit